MIVDDYVSLPIRIKQIYDDCSSEEQKYLVQILEELSQDGYSKTYDTIWLQDFKEIPVDIMTFICDERYLGKSNNAGEAVYPYWKQCMQDIFEDFTKYQEIVFTGATRIGKTSTAVTCAAYMLYWLMCLRDPQKFFGKKEISKFSIYFFNVTKQLASGVAYREFNDQLKDSPFFNEHGKFSKSDRDFYYIPDGGQIVINYGSDYSHALGQQVFCLTGDTKIRTDKGIQRLDALTNQTFKVVQYDVENNELQYSDETTCKITRWVDTTIRVTVCDGRFIEGTPEHMVMLEDTSYKMLKDLTTMDELLLYCPHVVPGYGNLIRFSKVDTIQYIHHKNKIPVYDIINATPNNNFELENCMIVHNCAIMDECNFARSGVKDITKAKEHMKELYDVVVARIEGTFRLRGKVYGKMFSVSSKKTDSDYMENHVQEQLEAGNEHMYIADKPQWEVLPPEMFSPEKFHIAVGDRHRKGFVVKDDSLEAIQELKDLGYNILEVPIDMKTNFLADFDISLRDLAGISVPGALSYITQETITECLGDRKNPFTMDILEVGTKDTYTIEEFFHDEYVDSRLKKMPLYIHLDLSITGDKTGICGSVVSGRKDIEDEDGSKVSMPTFSQLFILAIQAPNGDKIPYAKITNFIVWLRRKGFNIQGISKDTFQSEYVGQLLEAQGFDVTNISMDKTPDAYMALRSIMMEKRIDLLDVELYQDELIHLQRDGLSGKIDHPVGGCLTDATRIFLADTKYYNDIGLHSSMSIRELLDEGYEGHTVYTYNTEKRTVEIKPIKKVFKTKTSKVLEVTVRVIFDNRELASCFYKFKCTSDHRFMMENGEFIEAKDSKGVRLKCLSINNLESDKTYCTVSNIQELEKEYDVYDLEIEDNHNFAVVNGLFIHNSKDTSDALAGSVWNATKNNGSVPVDRKKVAHVVSSVNQRRPGKGKDDINHLFGPSNYRKQ